MLLVYVLISVVAGILVARNASNATLSLVAVVAAFAAPVPDLDPLSLVFKFSVPALLIGMVAATLYERTFGRPSTPRDS